MQALVVEMTSDGSSQMRGRKAKVNIDEQFAAYRDNESKIVDENGKVQPASADIFEQLSLKFERKMTPKGIQIAVTKHLEAIFGGKYKNTPKRPTDSLYENDSENETGDIISNDLAGTTISCSLNESEITNLKLVQIKGPSRNYMSLRPGWADTVNSIVTRATNTQCCFSFNSRDIFGNEFRAKATCSECKGTLSVVSSGERTRVCIQIDEGPLPHTFTKRRRLAKDRAQCLLAELDKETVHNVHMKSVNSVSDDAEHLPRDFPNRKSLENLKYRRNTQEDSAINVLRQMKYLPGYSSTIKEICTDPFRTMFWTPSQTFIYFQLKKRQRICLSFDATGGLISRSSILFDIKHRFDKMPEIPHIFLYLMCVKNCDGVSVPVGQMLSSQQDSTTISMFLNRWLDDFSQPDEIVTDDSSALQKSIVRSFTRFQSVKDYVEACFMILNGEKINLPEVFLRNDVPHYIKNLHKDKTFRKIDKRVKHFYLSAIGFILQSEDYDAIKSVVKDMLVAANYPICGTWHENKLPTDESLRNLNNVIQTHEMNRHVQVEEETECDDKENQNQNNDDSFETDCVKWFDDMLVEIQSTLNEMQLPVNDKSTIGTNWYYFPKINSFLRKNLTTLPLWSAVMRKYFESEHLTGISTDIESRFNHLKNNVFRNVQLPTRPDVFVKKFLDEIDGLAKLSRLMLPRSDENNNIPSNGEIENVIYTQVICVL